MRILFYGEICKSLIRSGYIKNMGKVSKLYFPSPISLGGKMEMVTAADDIDKGVQLDLEKRVDIFLQEKNCEYLVLDLGSLCNHLFRYEGNLYTFPTKDLQEKIPFYMEQELAEENPTDNAPELYFDNFDTFIDRFLCYFESTRIILIHTNIPKYFVVGKYVKKSASSKLQTWINRFEQRFIGKTKCRFLDITKYYFSQKERKDVIPYKYENLCYHNIAYNLKQALLDNEYPNVNSILGKLSVYDSYLRYSKYSFNLNKAFMKIFLTENIVDEYVKTCSEEWVVQNINALVILRELQFAGVDDLVQFLRDKKIDSELFMCLEAYCYIIKKNYTANGVRYDLLFEKGHAIPELLNEVQNYVMREKLVTSKKQINYYNYSYYFYVMLSTKTKKIIKTESLEHKNEFEKTVKKPHLVDVWGSCISRLPINYNEKNIAVENYLFQIPPIGLFDKPVAYDDKVFLIGKRKAWRDKLAKMQLERRAHQEIINSEASWVVLDLFTLSACNICKYEEEIFCLEPKVRTALNADIIDFYNDKKMIEYVKSELYIFANFLRQKYKDNIILVKNKRSEYYLKGNGKIEVFKKRKRNIEKNKFTSECNELLFRYLNCYYIDIVDQFLGDEQNMFELASTHYEEELYKEEGQMIQNIIENRPEEKHICKYSNCVRVNRMIKLRKNNGNNQIIRNLFTSETLDEVCLDVSVELLEQYKELWIELYNQNFQDKKEILHYIAENPRFNVIAPCFNQ